MTRRGVRIAVLDDNPHVRWQGQVHAADATFDQFLPALLDVAGIGSIVHCVPVSEAPNRPATLPSDPRIEIVATRPFAGIGAYLARAPRLIGANVAVLRPVVAGADLVWIKVPASNAPVAGYLAARAGVARFGYVAGSALAVARARHLGLAASAIGLAYDAAGRIAGGRHRIVVGEGIVGGGGMVTSLVEPDEIQPTTDATWPADPSRVRLAWAGRVVPGKGLETLLEAVATWVRDVDVSSVELIILGDGRARSELEARAVRDGLDAIVRWHGFVADRGAYLNALAAADAFVFPSPAEGFPKVILDAMAVGLPVLANPSSDPLKEMARAGLIVPIGGATPADIAGTLRDLVATPARAVELRRRGAAFAAGHTRPAEAQRLVATLRERFRDLPW